MTMRRGDDALDVWGNVALSIDRYSVHEHTLDSSFTTEGEFWLPATPEARFGGVLTYEPGSIRLKLVGSSGRDEVVRGEGGLLDDHLSEIELILGSTFAGNCTLWRSIRTNSTQQYGPDEALMNASFSANRLYLGERYESVGDIQFKDVLVSFDTLPTWVEHNPFGTRPAGSDALHVYVPFEPLLSVVPEDGLQIELASQVRDLGGGYSGFTWVHDVWFAVRSPSFQSIEWHLDRIERIQALLGTMVGSAALPTSIVGYLDGYPYRTKVIVPLKRPPSKESVHSFMMLMPLKKAGSRLPAVIAQWMRDWEKIGTTANLLFGTLIIDLPREFEFLALTQALETFHRHRYAGAYVDPSAYEEARRVLVDAIPGELPTPLKQALVSRIGYGNEFSQRKRFNELLGSLDDDAKGLLQMDSKFIELVVNERNHLTHRPPETDSDGYQPLSALDLYFVSQRLKGLLFLLLLSHLGFGGAEVKDGFAQTRWGRASRGWQIPPEVV